MATTNLDSLKINMLTGAQFAGIATPNPDELYMTSAQGLIHRSTGASGVEAHTEGVSNIASGANSHAEGNDTTASGLHTHAQNRGTVAQGLSQTAIGEYNVAQGIAHTRVATDHALIIGNGTSKIARNNAMSLTWEGTLEVAKDIVAAGVSLLSHKSRHASGGADALTPAEIGASASGHTHTAADVSAVPTTRTVNSKPLSANITLTATDVGAIGTDKIGQPSGVAGLDVGGKVPVGQLPAGLALGETASTAYRGDRGKLAYDHTLDETKHIGTAAKATPVDTDSLALVDSADGSKVKRLTWANLKAMLGGLLLPASHASSATTYGIGRATLYGHLKLSDATDSTSGVNSATAATPAAVKAVFDKADVAENATNIHVADVTKHISSLTKISPVDADSLVLIDSIDGDKAKRFSWANAKASLASSTYDIIIRTQAEFEALIASPTWLDAKNVCFIGDGGTLKFTRSNGQGCKIPQTVKNIQGLNSATIEVTNFVYHSTTNRAGLWYSTTPTAKDYAIDGMTVEVRGLSLSNGFYFCTGVTNCTAISTATNTDDGRGFHSCTYLANCTGTGTGNSFGSCGFHSCKQLVNCTGTGVSTDTGAGFNVCTQLTNCTGVGTGTNTGIGFGTCTQLVNCVGTGNGTSVSIGQGQGFNGCTQLTNCTGVGTGFRGYGALGSQQFTNCTGTGTGTNEGYGFYSCNYLNGCKQGSSPSTTAFLGGPNTKVDTLTVVAT